MTDNVTKRPLSTELLKDLRRYEFQVGDVFIYNDPNTAHQHSVAVVSAEVVDDYNRNLVVKVISSTNPELDENSKISITYNINGAPLLGTIIPTGLLAIDEKDRTAVSINNIIQYRTLGVLKQLKHKGYREKISILLDTFTMNGVLDDSDTEKDRKKRMLSALKLRPEIFKSTGGWIQLLNPSADFTEVFAGHDATRNDLKKGGSLSVIEVDKDLFIKSVCGLIESFSIFRWK